MKPPTARERRLDYMVDALIATLRPASLLLHRDMSNKLELDVHLILQRMKELDTNALPHIEQRLVKLETSQKWLTAISLLILGGTIAGVISSILS